MKALRFPLLLITLFVFISFPLRAQKEIHYDQESFDIEEIVKTVNSIPGKDTVFVKLASGIYYIQKTIVISKDSRHPIKFVGSDAGQTIFCGAKPVKGIRETSDGRWVIDLSSAGMRYTDQFFVNYLLEPRAKTPNSGFFSVEDVDQVVDSVAKRSNYSAKFTKEDIKSIKKISRADSVIVTNFRKWELERLPMGTYSKRGKSLSFNAATYMSYKNFQKGSGVILENYLNAIDQEGEWANQKNGLVYYYPRREFDIRNSTCLIPQVETIISIKGTKKAPVTDVVFENIRFVNSGHFVTSSEGNHYHQGASSMSACIEVLFATNVVIRNCEIDNIANYAVSFGEGTVRCSLTNSYIHDVGTGGVKIGPTSKKSVVSDRISVVNNIITNYGLVYYNGIGVLLMQAHDCTISHNDISNGEYSGISVGWSWGYSDSPSVNNTISYNKVHDIGTGLLSDMGGIYTLGKSKGTVIDHNMVYNIPCYNCCGIYTDEGSSNILIQNNIVYNIGQAGFNQHYGADNIIRNNIFAWSKNHQVAVGAIKEDHPFTFERNIVIFSEGDLFGGAGGHSPKFDLVKNCYWSYSYEIPPIKNRSFEDWMAKNNKNSLNEDPLFVDAQNNDFRIKSDKLIKKIGFTPINTEQIGISKVNRWYNILK